MADINTPSRGQPIDVSLLANIVDSVSNLQEAQRAATLSSISKVKANTSSIKFFAESQSITINNITTVPEQTYSFDFTSAGFASTPIAVVSVTNKTSTVAGANAATVVLTSVAAKGASGIVKFPSGSSGSVTIEVNIIAVGLV